MSHLREDVLYPRDKAVPLWIGFSMREMPFFFPLKVCDSDRGRGLLDVWMFEQDWRLTMVAEPSREGCGVEGDADVNLPVTS